MDNESLCNYLMMSSWTKEVDTKDANSQWLSAKKGIKNAKSKPKRIRNKRQHWMSSETKILIERRSLEVEVVCIKHRNAKDTLFKQLFKETVTQS